MLMQVRTEKLGELPLVDFYPVDYGQQQQAFGFEVTFSAKNLIGDAFFLLGGAGLLQVASAKTISSILLIFSNPT